MKAFTLVEMLIVLAIVAILAALAIPAIAGALKRAQLAQTTSNLRQLSLISSSMFIDTQSSRGAKIGWPDNNNFPDYIQAMVDGKYASAEEIQKLLSADDVRITDNPPSKSAVRIYQVRSSLPEDVILASTYNWDASQPAALTPASKPYGDMAYVFVRKNGEAAIGAAAEAGAPLLNQPAEMAGNPGP